PPHGPAADLRRGAGDRRPRREAQKSVSVLLGYLHGAEISASFQASLQALIAWDAGHGRHLRQYAALKCSTDGIVAGRNSLAKALLESDCEWMLRVDSVWVFCEDALARLHA